MTIEEYLGERTEAYYAALGEAQGGSYQPERDATPFVRLCVEAHLAQVRRRLLQLDLAAERWSYLERVVEQRGWPDRLVIALEHTQRGRGRTTRYVASERLESDVRPAQRDERLNTALTDLP